MTDEIPDVLRAGDGSASRRRVAALVATGRMERVAPGVYADLESLDGTSAAWASISIRRPDATLCLLSALSIHDLTDEIPAQSHIALPRGAHKLKVTWEPVRWHFFDPATFGVGRQQYRVTDRLSMGLYGPERTIIDAFRLRHIWGTDLATEALKRWLRHPNSSPGGLLDMASGFPLARPALRNALEVLL